MPLGRVDAVTFRPLDRRSFRYWRTLAYRFEPRNHGIDTEIWLDAMPSLHHRSPTCVLSNWSSASERAPASPAGTSIPSIPGRTIPGCHRRRSQRPAGPRPCLRARRHRGPPCGSVGQTGPNARGIEPAIPAARPSQQHPVSRPAGSNERLQCRISASGPITTNESLGCFELSEAAACSRTSNPFRRQSEPTNTIRPPCARWGAGSGDR